MDLTFAEAMANRLDNRIMWLEGNWFTIQGVGYMEGVRDLLMRVTAPDGVCYYTSFDEFFELLLTGRLAIV
jgi:hypothetical protein